MLEDGGGTGDVVKLAGLSDLTEIGRGGFGVVYRATQAAMGRQVAVKVLPGLDQVLPERQRGAKSTVITLTLNFVVN